MSKEKRELRKEVLEFMKEQGHPNKLDFDGNQIPYGIVNHLIASFHERKVNQRQSLPIDLVSKSFTEKQMDDAYDKGYSDGLDNRAC